VTWTWLTTLSATICICFSPYTLHTQVHPSYCA
jgi:hypothetical protein